MAKAKPLPGTDLPRTVEEFERWHADQPEPWEFIAGVPVMMAPPSMPHTIIKSNIGRHLGNKLEGTPCVTFVDGAQVKSRGMSAIPDVVVSRGRLDQATPTVDEPTLVVEVLSPSSERDDLGRKWQGYCLIPSLRHYLVVAQETRFATLHTRTGPSSFDEEVFEAGAIELRELGVSLTFDEIYARVVFPEPEPDA